MLNRHIQLQMFKLLKPPARGTLLRNFFKFPAYNTYADSFDRFIKIYHYNFWHPPEAKGSSRTKTMFSIKTNVSSKNCPSRKKGRISINPKCILNLMHQHDNFTVKKFFCRPIIQPFTPHNVSALNE